MCWENFRWLHHHELLKLNISYFNIPGASMILFWSSLPTGPANVSYIFPCAYLIVTVLDGAPFGLPKWIMAYLKCSTKLIQSKMRPWIFFSMPGNTPYEYVMIQYTCFHNSSLFGQHKGKNKNQSFVLAYIPYLNVFILPFEILMSD